MVAAYDTPGGCVVSPSIEAKRFGIKTGMTVRDTRLLYPPVIVLKPDPPKYRYVHQKFCKIFKDYSPDVTPKSIDEAVIDLTHTLCLFKGTVEDIGKEIKRRLRTEIGEWMSCSIGVGTNRFLAKLAASLHKPDGLDVIDHTNVLDVYRQVKLLDLNGINTSYQARLNAYGIFTPEEFLYQVAKTLTHPGSKNAEVPPNSEDRHGSIFMRLGITRLPAAPVAAGLPKHQRLLLVS